MTKSKLDIPPFQGCSSPHYSKHFFFSFLGPIYNFNPILTQLIPPCSPAVSQPTSLAFARKLPSSTAPRPRSCKRATPSLTWTSWSRTPPVTRSIWPRRSRTRLSSLALQLPSVCELSTVIDRIRTDILKALRVQAPTFPASSTTPSSRRPVRFLSSRSMTPSCKLYMSNCSAEAWEHLLTQLSYRTKAWAASLDPSGKSGVSCHSLMYFYPSKLTLYFNRSASWVTPPASSTRRSTSSSTAAPYSATTAASATFFSSRMERSRRLSSSRTTPVSKVRFLLSRVSFYANITQSPLPRRCSVKATK